MKTYFESGASFTQTVRNLRKKFLDQFVKRVSEIGSLFDERTRLRSRPVRSAENIAVVAQSVLEHPSTSTHYRSQELNITRTFLRRILHKDFGMKAYKIQIVQEQHNNRSFAHRFRKSNNQPKF